MIHILSDPINIKAVFKGKDGSLGYRHNHIYELTIYNNGQDVLSVESKGQEGRCAYANKNIFLQNWMTSRKVLIEKVGYPTI